MKDHIFDIVVFHLFEILRLQWDEGIRQREQTLELVDILKEILIQEREYIMEKDENNTLFFEERVRLYQQELAVAQASSNDFPYPTFFVQAGKLYSFERDVVVARSKFPEEFRTLFALQASNYQENTSQIEYFLNYQQQVSFQNDIESSNLFLQGLLHNEADILYYASVISSIKEWLQKTEADLHQIEYSPVKNKSKQRGGSDKTIHIQESIINPLFEKLKPFFSAEDQARLFPLLQGERLTEKLHFLSQQNILADIFRQLKEKKLILESKAHVKRWLCEHFTYRNAKINDQIDLNQGVVHQIIYNHADRKVQKESRIDLSEILSKK